jgi:hypothetical protein
MSEKRLFVLAHDQARRNAAAWVMQAPAGYVVQVKPPTRSLEANAALWATLTDISEQVEWHGRRLSPESWKTMLTASLKKQDVMPGIDGGFVVMGSSTSKMTKQEFSELLELARAFGAQHGVNFRDTK